MCRQASYQVHSHLLEGESVFFRRDSVGWCVLPMRDDLVLLTGGTAFDILRYPLVHSWPGLVLFGFADGFVSSRMSCCGVVVYQFHEVLFLLVSDHCL